MVSYIKYKPERDKVSQVGRLMSGPAAKNAAEVEGKRQVEI